MFSTMHISLPNVKKTVLKFVKGANSACIASGRALRHTAPKAAKSFITNTERNNWSDWFAKCTVVVSLPSSLDVILFCQVPGAS